MVNSIMLCNVCQVKVIVTGHSQSYSISTKNKFQSFCLDPSTAGTTGGQVSRLQAVIKWRLLCVAHYHPNKRHYHMNFVINYRSSDSELDANQDIDGNGTNGILPLSLDSSWRNDVLRQEKNPCFYKESTILIRSCMLLLFSCTMPAPTPLVCLALNVQDVNTSAIRLKLPSNITL